MQEKTKAKYRERVERQFKIVKPDATAAELKDVVDGDFQDIFAKHLMTNQHKAAQQAIADINDKHQVRCVRWRAFRAPTMFAGHCQVGAQHHGAASGMLGGGGRGGGGGGNVTAWRWVVVALVSSRDVSSLPPPQLFVDMAVLVESQGELLNQIEHNVEQAVGYPHPSLITTPLLCIKRVSCTGTWRREWTS
jgi:hypothetical protein